MGTSLLQTEASEYFSPTLNDVKDCFMVLATNSGVVGSLTNWIIHSLICIPSVFQATEEDPKRFRTAEGRSSSRALASEQHILVRGWWNPSVLEKRITPKVKTSKRKVKEVSASFDDDDVDGLVVRDWRWRDTDRICPINSRSHWRFAWNRMKFSYTYLKKIKKRKFCDIEKKPD